MESYQGGMAGGFPICVSTTNSEVCWNFGLVLRSVNLAKLPFPSYLSDDAVKVSGFFVTLAQAHDTCAYCS